MKVLIVGAGAVGQVYGYCLLKGGAEVTFYVRPERAAALKAGAAVYPLNRRRPLEKPERLQGCGVISTDAEAAAAKWDYVIVCTHAGAVLSRWFEGFAAALKGGPVYVNLFPDEEVRAKVRSKIPDERVVEGLITLISYMAPLPGEKAPEPGVAFWLPPLAKVPFRGRPEQVGPLVDALGRGGMACSAATGEASSDEFFADAVLFNFVLALEGAGWSLKAFLEPRQSKLAKDAILETVALERKRRGLPAAGPGLAGRLLGRTFFRALIAACRAVMPFDLETYLKVHFTKIREQGRHGLASRLRSAGELGLPVPALRELARQVGAQ